jgi:hypothetical protein
MVTAGSNRAFAPGLVETVLDANAAVRHSEDAQGSHSVHRDYSYKV